MATPGKLRVSAVSYVGAAVIFSVAFLLSESNNFIPLMLWNAHYLKRTYEVFNVHRYSDNGPSLFEAIQEWVYYFGFSLWISWELCQSPSPIELGTATSHVRLGTGLFILSMLGNFHSHIVLRNLRTKGSTKRGIPMGGLFEYICCPHYFFEIATWMSFAIVCGGQFWSVNLFALVGSGILCSWALERRAAYRSEFPQFPKSRKAIFPGLL